MAVCCLYHKIALDGAHRHDAIKLIVELHFDFTSKYRLSEGHGSAIYEIGVADDGSFVGLSPQDMEVSLQTLQRMADFLKADVTILRRVSVESTQQGDTSSTEDGSGTSGVVRRRLSTNIGSPRTDPEYMVVEARVTSRLAEEHHFLEIRVALVGGPDAGKSTLLGRLAHGIADNGRGKASMYRQNQLVPLSHMIKGYKLLTTRKEC